MYATVCLYNCLGPVTTAIYEPSGAGAGYGIIGSILTAVGQGVSDFRQIAEHSNYVLFHSINPVVTTYFTNTPFRLAKMKERLAERGVKVVGIDPRLHHTNSFIADEWVPINPGTDTALFEAMSYVIIEEGLANRDMMERFTVGYDKWEAHVLGQTDSNDPEIKRWVDGTPRTPEWAERLTGIPAKKIREIAVDYATKKPAAFFVGVGPNRAALGETYIRAAYILPFMTGNVGVPGTWADVMANGILGWFPPYPLKYMGGLSYVLASMAGGGTLLSLVGMLNTVKSVVIPSWQLGWALDNPGKPMYLNVPVPDIRAIVGVGNPFITNPDPHAHHKAYLNPRIEFICNADLVMTPTLKHSDIVLPAAHYYEYENFYSHFIPSFNNHPHSMYAAKLVEPMGESKEDLWIFHELAKRFGKGYIFETNPSFDEWMRNGINMARALDPAHPTYEEMKSGKKNPYKGKNSTSISLRAAFDNQVNKGIPFGTPSGKYEIYSELIERETNSPNLRNMTWRQNDFPGWKDMKYCVPALPIWHDHWEGVTDPLREKYPYQMINPRSLRTANTTHSNNRLIEDCCGKWDAWINARDAATKGVKNGDIIEVFNDRGRVTTRAFATERVPPGVVAMDHGKWPHWRDDGVAEDGGGDVLTKSEFCGGIGKGTLLFLGGAPTNTNLVDFIKVADAPADEESYRQPYYTFGIDGKDQTEENVLPQFIENVSWQDEKSKGITAERNIQRQSGSAVVLPGNRPKEQWGWHFNQSRCSGCMACMVACKDWKKVALGPAKYRRVSSEEDGQAPLTKVYNLSLACNHCSEPSCIPACPVGNIVKRQEDGIVVTLDKCISCKRCKAACPYDAPQFATLDPTELPIMEKCDMCLERLAKGLKPVCVDACPQRALDAGPIDELIQKYGDVRIIKGGFADPSLTKPNIIFKERVFVGV